MATPVMIAGLPGRMAAEVVKVFLDHPVEGFELLPVALCGASNRGRTFELPGWRADLVGLAERDGLVPPPGTMVVDFTAPAGAVTNIAWYVERGFPFVLGTTGFDAALARLMVQGGRVPAVIAPNMSAPIVAIQWALHDLAQRFPDALRGFTGGVTESHQSTKKDTSGTARAIVADLARLGVPVNEETIVRERDPDRQRLDWGVPPEHLAGHAYHRYEVLSAGGDVALRLHHDVHGRRTYAEGTWRALSFLAGRVAAGDRGVVYTMRDVLAAPLTDPEPSAR